MSLWATFKESMVEGLRSEAELKKVLDGMFAESDGWTLEKNLNYGPE